MSPLMFRPDRKYLTKIYIEASLLAFFVIAVIGWLGYLVGRSEFAVSMGGPGLLAGVLMNLVWVIPTILIIHRYYHGLHYEIHEDEVIMHVGVITKTVKHVPFRAITNIKVKRGPFDRLFHLGTIDIQTAGRSGESGAEESLVGLSNFRELYNQIAYSLRNLQSALSPTQSESTLISFESSSIDKILDELQQIRRLIEENQ